MRILWNIKFLLPLIFVLLACKKQKSNEELYKEYLDLGKDKVIKEDYRGAIEAFGKAIEANPKDADLFFNRAYSLETIGNYQQALKDYDQAIILNPQFVDAYNNRGEIRRTKIKDLKGAISDFDTALKVNNQVPGIYFNRALAKVAQKDNDSALEDFTKVIELTPRFAEAYYNRGALLLAKGYKENACQDWDKAYQLGKEESADLVKKYCL